MDEVINENRLFKKKFAKNVALIAGGTAFAQIIGVLLSPIVTRIYSPDEFGVLTIFISILGAISLMGSLSYESAIPIADDDIKAINIFSLSLIVLFLISILLSIIIFCGGEYFLQVLNATELINYKYFLIIGFIMTGVYTILDSWSLRTKNYKVIAMTKYSQSIIGNVGKIILGMLRLGPSGLIFGQILGQSAGIIYMFRPILKNQKELLKSINMSSICWSAKRYVRFPKYSAPTILIISLSSQLPVYFLSAFYTSHTIGLYGLALTITFLPMSLIGKSVQDVFFGEAASLGKSNPEEIKKLSQSLLRKLLVIGAVPMVILSFLGPKLFSFIFGDNWIDAGTIASILTIYAYTHFIFHPISTVFSIFEEQHLQLYLNLAKIVLIIIVFYIAKIFGFNAYYAIFLFSVVMGITELLKFLLAHHVLNKRLV